MKVKKNDVNLAKKVDRFAFSFLLYRLLVQKVRRKAINSSARYIVNRKKKNATAEQSGILISLTCKLVECASYRNGHIDAIQSERKKKKKTKIP